LEGNILNTLAPRLLAHMKVGYDHFKLLYSHCYRIFVVGSYNGRIKYTSFIYV